MNTYRNTDTQVNTYKYVNKSGLLIDDTAVLRNNKEK